MRLLQKLYFYYSDLFIEEEWLSDHVFPKSVLLISPALDPG